MSNLDPTHAIPLLAAGALQSGMAFIIMPTVSGGFAVLLAAPEPVTDAEIEANSISAIADIDIMDTPPLMLSRQICVTTRKLAEFLVSQCTPEECVLAHVEQSTFDLLKSERTAALAELPPTLTETIDLPESAYDLSHGMAWADYSADLTDDHNAEKTGAND